MFVRISKSKLSALFVCVSLLVAALLVCDARAMAGVEHSLFRTASELVDIDSLDLLLVHESAGVCPWILVAYSDGCGHCRSAAPSIIACARETFENTNDVIQEVTVAALNCQVSTQACNDLDVTGVPSFFLLTPSFLAARGATLSPVVLHPRENKVTQGPGETSAPVTLHRFDLGRGGGIGPHLELARSIWGAMSNHTWSGPSRERCLSMRSFLRYSKQSDVATLAQNEAALHGAGFKEETEFHAVDVANAFFFTLYHEVALVGLESAQQRYALHRFLRAVQQRLPGLGADVLLHEMSNHSAGASVSFSVAEWQRLVLSAGIPFQGTPRDLAWKTCRGSSWRYRGFPCGLWLLYHALTANAEASDPSLAAAAIGKDGVSPFAENSPANLVQANTEVLFIIKDYVRNFFSCETCRRHFMHFDPNHDEDPVWQLWKVHNVVNHFLANVTDGADPLVPKRQFPGRQMCPLCYRDLDVAATSPENAVVASEMIGFLRRRYRWCPSSLRSSTYPAVSPSAAVAADADAGGKSAGSEVILVQKTPMSINVLLTMAVVVVVVILAMRYVLRRAKSSKARRHRSVLPLRMQP